MNILSINHFESNCKVPTEDTFLNGLNNNKDKISNQLTLVDFNWAKCINTIGPQKTQSLIYEIVDYMNKNGLDPKNAIYICQHISGECVNWYSKYVFSPHANFTNDFFSIPPRS